MFVVFVGEELCFKNREGMVKKLYFHYKGKYSEEEKTEILLIDENCEVKDVLRRFLQKINLQINENNFCLILSSNEIITEGKLEELVEDKDDCLVRDIYTNNSPSSSSSSSSLETTTTNNTLINEKNENNEKNKTTLTTTTLSSSQIISSGSITSPVPSTTTTTTVSRSQSNKSKKAAIKNYDISGALTEIQQFMNKKEFRRAKIKCEEVLQISINNYTVLEHLTHISFASKHYSDAITYGEKAVASNPRITDSGIFLILGQSYIENHDYEDAISILRRGLKLLEKKSNKDTFEQNLVLTFKAEICRSLYLLGRHPEAGSLVNDIMTTIPSNRTADPQNNLPSLLIYAEIALQYDKIPEALQGALKVVIVEQNNKRAKKVLAQILSTTKGMNELYKQVPPSPGATSAYSFLGTTIKDNSALSAAEELFRKAIELELKKILVKPSEDIHNHVLNLVHILETSVQPKNALNEIKTHLLFYSNILQGNQIMYREIINELNQTLEILSNIQTNSSLSLFFPPIFTTNDPPNRIVWQGSTENTDISSYVKLVPVLIDETQESLKNEVELLSDNNPPLDLLAILFTAIKILFVQGNLGSATRLIHKVDQLRKNYQIINKIPLHSTSIRNEHAYYLCICQILNVIQQYPSTLRTFPYYEPLTCLENRPIYLCGDSHCLSPAWSQINVPSEMFNNQSEPISRLLVPKLVTGLKQWHLRPESDFYPKEGFQRLIATIPERSDVIKYYFIYFIYL